MSAQRFVYRLEVDYPEGSEEYGWEPEGWVAEQIAVDEWDHFHWPVVKPYLSRTGAVARARLFERYGATVRIFRSAPVEWPDGGEPVKFGPPRARNSVGSEWNPRDVAILGGDPSL